MLNIKFIFIFSIHTRLGNERVAPRMNYVSYEMFYMMRNFNRKIFVDEITPRSSQMRLRHIMLLEFCSIFWGISSLIHLHSFFCTGWCEENCDKIFLRSHCPLAKLFGNFYRIVVTSFSKAFFRKKALRRLRNRKFKSNFSS